MNVKRMLCAGSVAAAAISGVVASPALAATPIQGDGSTLVAPLAAEWTASYNATQSTYSVSYSGTGSGPGITSVEGSNPQDAFAGSDIPLTGTSGAYAQFPNGVAQVPWALTATAMAYNIPGLQLPAGKSLQLTGTILAKIYTGKITNWSDPAILAANTYTTKKVVTKVKRVHGKKKKVRVVKFIKTSAKLPNLTIAPVVRSGGSGDSYAVESFLNKADGADWPYTPAGTWPVSTTGTAESGNLGVLSQVENTNGAIGYVAASYLIENSYTQVAAIATPEGTYTLPNATAIGAAAAGVTPPAQGPDFNLPIQYVNNPNAYPISTFTYGILPEANNATNKAGVKAFVGWVLGPGQSEGADLDFVPLPTNVLGYAKGVLNSY